MNGIDHSFATPAMWAGFIIFVLAMLALDLFVFGGRNTACMFGKHWSG